MCICRVVLAYPFLGREMRAVCRTPVGLFTRRTNLKPYPRLSYHITQINITHYRHPLKSANLEDGSLEDRKIYSISTEWTGGPLFLGWRAWFYGGL